MSKKKRLLSAGAIALRDGEGGREVLVVHRPALEDWSLPKGKPNPDEDLPVVAVREMLEETGVRVRASAPLGHITYPTSKGTKHAYWWLGHPIGGELNPTGARDRPGHRHEVDIARWMPVEDAAETLTYPEEREVLARALATSPHHTVLLVRHGKAMLRKHWTGKDWKRPLSARGRRQAKRLAQLLDAYGVTQLASSTSTRCVQTLEPYAKASGLTIEGFPELSEESHENDPEATAEVMSMLLERARLTPDAPLAFSGHRPVLPTMRAAMGLPDQSMLVAETAVLHVMNDGRDQLEVIKSAF